MSNQAAAMIFYCSFYLFIIVFFFFKYVGPGRILINDNTQD